MTGPASPGPENRPVAVVTGASGGLGREIALALGLTGYLVVVNYLRSEQRALETASLLGDSAIALRADVKSFNEVEEMAGRTFEHWGRVDAVVNNAGINRDRLILKTTDEEFDEVFSVNLTGCFNTAKAFSPFMIRSGGGHIMNIASYSGLRGSIGQTAYSASKAGVLGFTYAAARELACHNIRVNAVLPGYLPAGMGQSSPWAIEKARQASILGRLSDPAEVGRFIALLLGLSNVTGQVFGLESRI